MILLGALLAVLTQGTGDTARFFEYDRDAYIQLAGDLGRGFDLLAARKDVDTKRIGYVGHSLGATWGGALAGVDPRFAGYMLMGGLPRLTDILGDDS